MAADEAYSGTSGRVKLAFVSPDLATDEITFTTSSRTNQVAVMKWDLKINSTVVQTTTLETTADAQGNLAPVNLRGGTISYIFSVQGLFNGTESVLFMAKPSAVADFIVKKGSSGAQTGFPAVPGTIQNFAMTGIDAQSNEPVMCSFEYVVSGVLPAFSSTIT